MLYWPPSCIWTSGRLWTRWWFDVSPPNTPSQLMQPKAPLKYTTILIYYYYYLIYHFPRASVHLKHAFSGGDMTCSSPITMRVLPVLLSHRDNVLVLCKKLSKFYEPPLKWFEIFHQVYINLPLSGNVNKRKYRKPSKTVK